MVASYHDIVGIVDQAVDKGRITVLSDMDVWKTFWNESSKDLLMRFLLNSKSNKEKVENGENPNEGFGQACQLQGEIAALGKTWTGWTDSEEVLSSQKDVEVTMAGSDMTCGLQSIAYYLSSEKLSEEQLGALTEEQWKELTVTDGKGSFTLSQEGSTIIYGKTVDAKGNVCYLASDVIQLDKTPIITPTPTVAPTATPTIPPTEPTVTPLPVQKDTTPPVGKILVEKDNWTTYQDEISFSHFYKTAVKVRIEANDEESGVQTISYYVSDKALKISELSGLKWRTYVSWFSLYPDMRGIIYVKIQDAAGYIVYGNRCNTKGHVYKMKKLKTISKQNITKWNHKKLKKDVYYKYLVVAYKYMDGKKKTLSVSKTVHAITKGGKYQNPKKVKIKKTSCVLKVGQKMKIKAKRILPKHVKIKEHVERFRYEVTNKKTATVTKKGVVKGKKPGTCYVYVYAQNGVRQRVKIRVK